MKRRESPLHTHMHISRRGLPVVPFTKEREDLEEGIWFLNCWLYDFNYRVLQNQSSGENKEIDV